jgi:recombination protein RecR
MDHISRLEYFFTQFPGIGSRQARRFVYYLLKQSPQHLSELSRLITGLHDLVRECEQCHRFFPRKGNNTLRCPACSDTNRDDSQLIIVEKDADLEAIERAHVFNGRTFVLGGTLAILEKYPERVIRIVALRRRIEEMTQLKEIIIGTAITPESEHTGIFVQQAIGDITNPRGISVTHLARGISTGSEIEYADADTLRSAILGRK